MLQSVQRPSLEAHGALQMCKGLSKMSQNKATSLRTVKARGVLTVKKRYIPGKAYLALGHAAFTGRRC